MGINFNALNAGSEGQAPVPVAATAPSNPVMGIPMDKNNLLDLTKRNPGLNKITIGGGWDPAVSGDKYDLDLCTFLLGEDGKVAYKGDKLIESVIYFKHKNASGIHISDDDTSGEGEGDDEQISITLSDIAPEVHAIVVCIVIFNAKEKHQVFKNVKNSYIRVLNAAEGDTPLTTCLLNDEYATDTAVIAGKLVRDGADWKFITIGDGKVADISDLLGLYM